MRATVLFATLAVATCNAGPILLLTSGNQLLTIESTTPGSVSAPLPITGLQVGETVLGIDFRPLTNELFGLGSTSVLYSINATTGVATQVGASGAFSLSGTSFGFDFNPTVDRIRVTSDADQNLRLNPTNGTLAATDAALNPGTPNVVGSAYTNNDNDALTGTTLYAIDSLTDQLFTQNPPNNGTLNLVGALGLDIGPSAGFDILFANEVNTAYAAFTVGGIPGLYTINLTTGAATLVGTIGNGKQGITGLAAVPVPEPGTYVLTALGLALVMGVSRRFSKRVN
jgi:hypothetical protein